MNRHAGDASPVGELLTPGEAAAQLRVHRATLVRWADRDGLTAVKTPGGHRRYVAAEVRALAEYRS